MSENLGLGYYGIKGMKWGELKKMRESFKKVTIIVEDETTIETTVFMKANKVKGSFEPVMSDRLELENGMEIRVPYSEAAELTFGLTAYRDAETGYASSTSTVVVKDI